MKYRAGCLILDTRPSPILYTLLIQVLLFNSHKIKVPIDFIPKHMQIF